jgi:hypothetical protein
MSNLSQAFGNFNKDSLRVRSFEFNGHTFKVKVPLTAESDVMFERLKQPNKELIEKLYEELSKNFKDSKADNVEILDNDIKVEGRSLRETAENKAQIQMRITEMFKLLVPEEVGFNMDTITYEMIDELFPFAIQMQLLELIGETVSPSYNATKGK